MTDYILLEYSGGKQTYILNFCHGVHFQHYQNHALYCMLGLGDHICTSTAISATLNRTSCFHSWLVCHLPNPFSLNWFGHNKFSFLNKQYRKILCTSLHLVRPLLLVGAQRLTSCNQLKFWIWGGMAHSIQDLFRFTSLGGLASPHLMSPSFS
jgi:hypothetical protein